VETREKAKETNLADQTLSQKVGKTIYLDLLETLLNNSVTVTMGEQFLHGSNRPLYNDDRLISTGKRQSVKGRKMCVRTITS
jgi:hypothetical protein